MYIRTCNEKGDHELKKKKSKKEFREEREEKNNVILL